MRILYLAQLIPFPLDAGPKTRMHYVLRYLASAGHDITLLAFSRETDTAESIDHLREFCSEIHTVPMVRSRTRDAYHLARSLLTKRPFLIARDDVAAMKAKAIQLAQQRPFDVIHADQLWMAPYALAAAAKAHPKPRLVLDQHNAMYLIPQRLAETSNGLQRVLLQRESVVMRRYELETCQRFDDVVWVTTEDRAAVGLRTYAGGSAPCEHIIPICVDPDAQPMIERVPSPHRVTFLGGLHWPPNAAGIIWFAREVWPQVSAQCPDAVLTVIGKNPPAELSAVAGIEVTGYVDDPKPYLRETAVFIVPLLAGGGMRVKILDAWCWGLPVVSTTIGAEGIGYTEGRQLILADDPAEYALAVARVLQNRSLADSLLSSGRSLVEQGYDWQTVYRQWDEVYDLVASPTLVMHE